MLTKKELQLRDYLKVIKKNRRVVWLIFLTVFGLTSIGTFATKPLYKATAKIIIEKNDANELTGSQNANSSTDPAFYQTQYQLIRSYGVSRKVAEMLKLEDNYQNIPGMKRGKLGNFVHKVKSTIENLIGIKGKSKGEDTKTKPSKIDHIAGIINKEIQVTPVENTRIVHISFMSSNPEFAALVANTTVKAYMEESLNMKMEATHWKLDWKAKKSEAEREKLNKAEKALQNYMKTNDIVTLENGATVTPDKLSEIYTQLIRAETKRKELEALNRQVQAVAHDPQAAETVAEISSDQALQALRGQIVESEKKIMELSGKYGPKHPVMIKARGDLRVLKEKRNQEIARMVSLIGNKYNLARTNEKTIRSALARTKAEALKLDEKLVQYNALKRDVDTNRQLYDALMLKIKKQSITQGTKPIHLWVMEKADVPRVPSKPLKGLDLFLGLFFGGFGGIGLAFLMEFLDNTVKEPEQAEEMLGSPVLGVIAQCKEKDRQMEEMVMKKPQSVFAESYNALRTALMFSSADRAPEKIVITSASPGEGKTTTAINLALTLAQSEKRVVLIDGDLRKPRLHKIFKMNNQGGLSSFLAGAAGNDIVRKGPLPNLAVITSGPIPPNPAELLSSTRMKSLIERLGKEFDIVICDSPPVLSVADSRMLCRVFEGAILVTRAHKTTYEVAAKALKSLHDVNVRVFGLVINGLDQKKGGYYHYDYFYSYGAHSESPKKALAREG